MVPSTCTECSLGVTAPCPSWGRHRSDQSEVFAQIHPHGACSAAVWGTGAALGPAQRPQVSPLSLLLQPAPLVLRPGPIYAVDGDRGVNQRVLYSIVTGECTLEPCLCILDLGGLARGQSQRGPQTSDPWTEREASPPPIFAGQDDGTFAIDANSGNLTMTRSVPSPKTFTLLVKVGALARPPWGRGFEDLLVAEASPTPRVSSQTAPATR